MRWVKKSRGFAPVGVLVLGMTAISFALVGDGATGTVEFEQGLQPAVTFNGDIGGGEFGAFNFTNPSILRPISTPVKVNDTINGVDGFQFQTFCVEPGESIHFHTPLNYTVSTTVQLPDGSTRNLSAATAYLFTKFWANVAFTDAYAYTPLGAARSASAANMQLAIWYTEGVSSYAGLPGDPVFNYIDEAITETSPGGVWAAVFGTDLDFPTCLGPVRALNLTEPAGKPLQDVLVLLSGGTPTPFELPPPPPPPEENDCEDRFTGGGFLFDTPTGARGTFAVAGGIKNGDFWGHLNFIDHGTKMHVKGLTVTAYTTTGPKSRHSEGTCKIDGVLGTYSLDITDNGEPGKKDELKLVLSTGYIASGVIDGGNIQLHKSKCCDKKK